MLTLTDLFCGAGGSSTGAVAVPGVEVRIASNHWDLAVSVSRATITGCRVSGAGCVARRRISTTASQIAATQKMESATSANDASSSGRPGEIGLNTAGDGMSRTRTMCVNTTAADNPAPRHITPNIGPPTLTLCCRTNVGTAKGIGTRKLLGVTLDARSRRSLKSMWPTSRSSSEIRACTAESPMAPSSTSGPSVLVDRTIGPTSRAHVSAVTAARTIASCSSSSWRAADPRGGDSAC